MKLSSILLHAGLGRRAVFCRRIAIIERRQPVWIASLQADDELYVIAFVDVLLRKVRSIIL